MDLDIFEILINKVYFLFGKDVADKVISNTTTVNEDTIKKCFIWSKTPEGYEYWERVHDLIVIWESNMKIYWGIFYE